ncbi:XRE family transcriptional regulator [Clostridium botulinum]|uniref:XRE family transcriptional regulator n=1 Tax=Clostridium botulinum TaxID=1491 RepID=UPI00174A699D|nr:XRE family transcriptional regulator [Clostridium botulinum]MBD5637145.1 XRE family transcriptional regulator [Clostridium botulinum]
MWIKGSYELVTFLDVSVDQFFFPNNETDKFTQRRQLDSLLEDISDIGLRIVSATAKEVKEVETGDE